MVVDEGSFPKLSCRFVECMKVILGRYRMRQRQYMRVTGLPVFLSFSNYPIEYCCSD